MPRLYDNRMGGHRRYFPETSICGLPVEAAAVIAVCQQGADRVTGNQQEVGGAKA